MMSGAPFLSNKSGIDYAVNSTRLHVTFGPGLLLWIAVTSRSPYHYMAFLVPYSAMSHQEFGGCQNGVLFGESEQILMSSDQISRLRYPQCCQYRLIRWVAQAGA